ncbi:MAG: hypothetical protein JST86_11910 [Bacteroidetes bacterium]|nr:hypothetical protein [Bacteroidota bacterium]
MMNQNLASTRKLRNKPGMPEWYEGKFSRDEERIAALLEENRQHDMLFDFSMPRELYRFLQFTAHMLATFPVGIYMRKRIRKNERLNYILQFRELLQVRNNIEKGSFAYDTLLFKTTPLQLFRNKSHLANLVCLAILFGDEFIDGIAAEYGKAPIQQLLKDESMDYYLRYRKAGSGHELYYAFDICDVLPQQVLQHINHKYGITYKAFYEHLQFLLQEMNRNLNALDEEKATAAAQLICRACNKCFDTYKADITVFDGNYTLSDLLQYQKTKDDDIIQVLLTLRAVLLDKKQLQYQKQFSSWSSMVRSMQLYDDMQDVAGDCDFQMNLLCYFSKNYFSAEWEWLQKNKEPLQHIRGLHLHSTIALHMPASCMMAMQYARHIAHTRLNWVQRKIQNYLWRKNWLGFNNPLLNENGFCLSAVMQKMENSIPLKLHFIHKLVFHIQHPLITDAMKWAHVFDIAVMDEELKQHLLKQLPRKQRYFLTSCFIEYPTQQKALLVQRLVSGEYNH